MVQHGVWLIAIFSNLLNTYVRITSCKDNPAFFIKAGFNVYYILETLQIILVLCCSHRPRFHITELVVCRFFASYKPSLRAPSPYPSPTVSLISIKHLFFMVPRYNLLRLSHPLIFVSIYYIFLLTAIESFLL